VILAAALGTTLVTTLVISLALAAAPASGDALAEDPDWLPQAELAAESGNTRAAFLLGVYYELLEKHGPAYRWYLQAAEDGLPRAQVRIGEYYQHGEGRPRDLAEALTWYRRAADAGSARGMDYLGIFLAEGYGVERDCAAAVQWFEKAVAGGYAPASNNLAYTLATCPDPAVRDGPRALALARAGKQDDIAGLDTLAAALAESGDFARALQIQQQAIDKARAAGDTEEIARFRAKLESYRAQKPWREDGSEYKDYIFDESEPEPPVPGTRI
jgi:tetratricopeptide (TPR) repeat protein